MPQRKIVDAAYTPRTDEAGTPVRKILPYKPTVNPCRFCPGKCCFLNVKVALPEALRYTATYQLPFFSGISIVPSDHPKRAFRIERDPRFVDPVDGWMGTGELQLRRQESGACHALVDANGFKRCGIYPARPSLCRLYPFSWESEDARGGPEMILCPTPYALTPSGEQAFLQDVEDGLRDWGVHEQVVAEWNGRSDEGTEDWTVDTFVRFALERTGQMVGVDPYHALAAGTADEQLQDQMIEAGTLRPYGPHGGPRGVAGMVAREQAANPPTRGPGSSGT